MTDKQCDIPDWFSTRVEDFDAWYNSLSAEQRREVVQELADYMVGTVEDIYRVLDELAKGGKQ